MVKFYIAESLIYPIEATREQINDGYYIPLIGGSLLLAYQSEGEIRLRTLQGQGGTIYGVEEDGYWVNQVGGAPIDEGWPLGLDREEAYKVSATKTTQDVGSVGSDKALTFGSAIVEQGPRAVIEPLEASVSVGATQEFRLIGLPIGQSFLAEANGATVETKGTSVFVTPTQYDEHVRLTVEVTGEEDYYTLSATLTPSIEVSDETEEPAPIEPAEPPVETEEEVQYETGNPLTVERVVPLPTIQKVSHRYRGPRESEKLNAYLVGMRYELNRLNEQEKLMREKMSADLNDGEIEVSLIEDERIVFLNKPAGVSVLRVGIRPEAIKSTSVKFEGASLNLSDYTLDVHGIMILSDQYAEQSGQIEVELTYDRTSESPICLTMDELKRRARRLEEQMCQVKEGIENG